ncbi:hypothetical protein BDA96_05G239200 [Sorghum bicolor]|uniref:Secreted protein n=2 Tax=Sorghum bicolor TaxID=4558 RepID=A0A921R2C7_SORBI|nr:hypothetical protein BDA96_05G239200 [Sorghum bicolor]KXG29178.1 hypothetical protein SORBI_3005G223200 [Sorghum bicolor]
MTRMVHYLMATMFVVLVMIYSNSTSCQASLFPSSVKLQPPCFEPPTHRCVDGRSCVFVCQYNGIRTYRAFCKHPTHAQEPYLCCCPL